MLETSLSRMLESIAHTLDCMTLADRVSEALAAAEANGFTVARVAAACGISVQAVYDWRKGATHEIDGSNLVELAELSGFNAKWIAKEEGAKTDPPAVREALRLLRKMSPEKQDIAAKIIAPLTDEDGGGSQDDFKQRA